MNLSRTSEPLNRTILFNIERGNAPYVADREGYCTLLLFTGGQCRVSWHNIPEKDPDTYQLQAPAVLCLCAEDDVELEYENTDVWTIVFAPTFLNVNMKESNHQPDWAALSAKHNLFNLSPFMERRLSLKVLPMEADEMAFYQDTCTSIEAALLMEQDECWSCRVRAELMDILLGLEVRYENRVLMEKDTANSFIVYRRMLARIHDRVHTTCQITDVCRDFGVNKNKLQVIFRTYAGRSFYGCVKKVKLEHAQRYLAFTKLSHAEIARYLGFSSATHFYRFFREETGESPRRYRQSAVAERIKDFAKHKASETGKAKTES